MHWLRSAATLSFLGTVAGAAAAEVVTSRLRPADSQQAQPCTVVSKGELEKARDEPVADLIQNLPSARAPEPKSACPPPADKRPQFPQRAGQGKYSITPSYSLSSADQRILDYHNSLRAEVGAAPLRWDPTLAGHARDYAQVLARTGQLVHAPREGRGVERENLQKGLINWGLDRMLRYWGAEKRNFRGGYYPNVALDGNWEDVSHYTQMIWPTTTDVGCGMAEGSGFEWFVCRYAPGGNKDGKPVGMIAAAVGGGAGAAASTTAALVPAGALLGAVKNDYGYYTRRQDYCSKQEQIDDLQTLQYQLIHTDESKPEGHAKGDEIRAEIQRVKQAEITPCERQATASSAAPGYAVGREFAGTASSESEPPVKLPASKVAPPELPRTEAKPVAPPPPPEPALTVHDRVERAEQALNEQIRKCEPIDVQLYQNLWDVALDDLQKLAGPLKYAEKWGAPLDPDKVKAARDSQRDLFKADDLLKRARGAENKRCPRPKTDTPVM